MNWDNITEDEKVKDLLIKRIYIEQEIKRLDKNALINYELEALTIPLVVGSDEWKADLHAKTQEIKKPKNTKKVRL